MRYSRLMAEKRTRRGWSSAGLRTVGDDPTLWTAADAAHLLGPPELTPSQVRALVRMAGLAPAGKRRVVSGRGARHARVFPASALIAAYEALYELAPAPGADAA